MANSVYIQYEFPKELMFQLPFVQIADFAKRNHAPHWREIREEIEIIAIDNRDEIVDLLGNSMIKAMTEDVGLDNISEDTLKEVKTKIDYLNEKFKYVNQYFDSLDVYGQRSLLLPFIDKEINSLVKYKERFRTVVTSKAEWNTNDTLAYSYYLLYLDNINIWRNYLKKASKDNIGSKINIIKGLVFVYKPILIAYMLNKNLPNELMIRRIAELRASINPPMVYTNEPKLYEISKAISVLSPI